MAVKEKDTTPRYLKATETLGSKVIRVGLFASAGSENIDKAITNEFGARKIFEPDGMPIDIPSRPFMRSTFDEEKDKVNERFIQVFKGINKGDFRVVEKLKRIGIEHEGRVKKKITDIRTPPNSQRTIKHKGFDNPLIHTGEMRSKVSSEVIDG